MAANNQGQQGQQDQQGQKQQGQGQQGGQGKQREQSNPGGSDQQGRSEIHPSIQQDGTRRGSNEQQDANTRRQSPEDEE